MRKRYYAIILMILTLGGCATTTHVYQVEVCLIGHEQEEGFYAFMQTVATTSHLVFKDGSDRFERDMQEIEHIGDLSALPGETIYFGAESESGTGGFTAANIGLNPLQIAVGMSLRASSSSTPSISRALTISSSSAPRPKPWTRR